MLNPTTLFEISSNNNTGVEYEIALFYQLLAIKPVEQQQVLNALSKRHDAQKVMSIIVKTDTATIKHELRDNGLQLVDACFETQNDAIGPSDIVMMVKDHNGIKSELGLSVKYNNTCSLNVTGKKFLSTQQIDSLQESLEPLFQEYIDEMNDKYDHSVMSWFRQRKPSEITDKCIDLIRDAVISNWNNVQNKTDLLNTMFHSNSPIEFWVVTYCNNGYTLKTKPQTIDEQRVNDVSIEKHETSYIAFYLDDMRIGKMQVKFNNGILEKCKNGKPDIVEQGIRMKYGKPFSSWNFSLEN